MFLGRPQVSLCVRPPRPGFLRSSPQQADAEAEEQTEHTLGDIQPVPSFTHLPLPAQDAPDLILHGEQARLGRRNILPALPDKTGGGTALCPRVTHAWGSPWVPVLTKAHAPSLACLQMCVLPCCDSWLWCLGSSNRLAALLVASWHWGLQTEPPVLTSSYRG